ncbi:MAG TPA: hypothetical protein VFW92_03465 [Candidatus Limnocylindrales bacterium]|nr:hypothetical protein [Candidatus Limnocylindrales bacterium]
MEPLTILDAAAVEAAMPDPEERLTLAERAMRALADGTARLPPKVGLEARATDSFAHAMPAWLGGPDPSGAQDLLGLKWVTGFPANAEAGWPAIGATVLLNDPRTGRVRAVLDGGPITAQRTAAVSGVALRLFGPAAGTAVNVGILGAGAQARSHIPIVGHLLPGARLRIFDRQRARAEAVAEEAGETGGIGAAEAVASAREAVDGAEVVVTLVSFGPPESRQALDATWLAPDATIVAVDYDMSLPASVAAGAAVFATDERAQFLAVRAEGWLSGYPDPPLTLGEALLHRAPRPPRGRVLVTHLGVGLADLVFAAAVLRRAQGSG